MNRLDIRQKQSLDFLCLPRYDLTLYVVMIPTDLSCEEIKFLKQIVLPQYLIWSHDLSQELSHLSNPPPRTCLSNQLKQYNINTLSRTCLSNQPKQYNIITLPRTCLSNQPKQFNINQIKTTNSLPQNTLTELEKSNRFKGQVQYGNFTELINFTTSSKKFRCTVILFKCL